MSTKTPKEPKKQFFYKLRRKSDGLFSSGGSYPRFSKRGKMWTRLSDVKSHLTHFRRNTIGSSVKYDTLSTFVKYMSDLEVLVYELAPPIVKPVEELYES